MIHIIDGQKDIILDYITANNIIDDTHRKSLIDTLETYNFITFADKRHSQYLERRNRIIIPDEDSSLVEFVIFEAHKYKDTEGHKAQVFAHASYLELKKASVLYPSTFEGTASQHGGRALNDTGWQVGIVEGKGSRKLTIEAHTNPYEFIKRIAKEFELELKFRIEHDGNKVTGRYVDLLERVGMWRGREVEFGKDLDGIRRVEKQDIVTALLGLGPEDENGSRLEVLVEDNDALQRWGRIDENGNLKHLIEPYEIQSERTEMTESEAHQYTRTALDKRINTQVTFETTIIDLENVPGMENKKMRFGDTIKIKDTTFNPPLFLEARVFEQDRSIKSKAKKDVKLGDYIEHTEDEVNAIWKQLEAQIRKRLDRLVIATIVSSAGDVFKNGVGSTQLTVKAFVNGAEHDENGTKYDYQWMKFDKDGNHITNWYEQGKVININANSIDEKATYRALIAYDLEVLTISEYTLTNVFDGEDGTEGPEGPKGEPGKDGRTPIKGTDYFDGVDGQDGKSSYLWVRYSQNANGNPMVPDPTNAKYIGIATTETSTAPTSYTAYTWSLVKGTDGVPGEVGTDGKTSYLHIKYSDNGTSFTANNGETVGAYIGTYVDFVEADSTVFSKYTWNKVKGDKGDDGADGVQGLQGPTGTQGIPGVKGADGKTSYTHIAYADNENGGGFSQSPTNKAYIGMYVDFVEQDSNVPSKYNWSLIKGADGTQGVAGPKGTDGKTPYFHTAWANNITGTSGFSTTVSAGKTHIGTYTDFVQADSNDPKKYNWSQIKGDKGDAGPSGKDGPQGIPGVKGADGKTTYTWVKYATTPTSGMSDLPTGKTYIGFAYNKLTATESTVYADYEWAKFEGNQGVPGVPGADGTPRYTWVKYANDENGSGMSDSAKDKRFLGLAHNKTTPTESNNPAEYSWSPLYDNVIVGGRNIIPHNPKLWEQGHYDTQGSPIHYPYIIRTKQDLWLEILPRTIYMLTKFGTDYDITINEYDENKTFISTGVRWITQNVREHAMNQRTKYIRVSLRKKGTPYITPDEMNDVRIKLEKGNISTDFSHAEEDFYADLKENHFNLTEFLASNDSWPHTTPAQFKTFELEPNKSYTLSTNAPESPPTTIYFNGQSTAVNGVWKGRSITLNSGPAGELYVAVVFGRSYADDILNGKLWIKLEDNFPAAIEDAKESAETAQTTADGKNTVIYSTSQPSTTGRKINDVWFDTDDGYKMYRFNGSAWVASQFGENAIVANSITANHIKSLFGLNVNDQFIVDANGNVKFTGNLTGATGTFGNVNVKDGDFTLEDNMSSVKYRATPGLNLINDHSFEMVKHDASTESNTANWAEMVNPSESVIGWKKSGSPKVAYVPWYGDPDHRSFPIYGDKAIVVRNASFVSQLVGNVMGANGSGIGANGKYTLSGYFKRHWAQTAGGTPRFEVDHMRGGSLVRRLINKTFDAVPGNYSVKRYAETFDVPSDFQDNDYLAVKITGGNANWIQCDGVQLVDGEMPTIYDPEDSVWKLTTGIYGTSLMRETLWEGMAYLQGGQVITPRKSLNDCMTGWVLQWEAMEPGAGKLGHNYQFTHVPKALLNMGATRGVSANLRRGATFIDKYFYVSENSFSGNDRNSTSPNNLLVLTAVYEY